MKGETDVGRQYDVLLVEDNLGDVRLIQQGFRRAGSAARLHVARDGEEAIRFLRREGEHAGAPRCDLVLLDLNLPRMDGRRVLGQIRADARLRRLPVIVLTTSRADDDVLKAYELGCNCYLTKPAELNRLLEVIKAVDTFWLGLAVLPPRDDQAAAPVGGAGGEGLARPGCPARREGATDP